MLREWLFEDTCIDEILEDVNGDASVFTALQFGKESFANAVYESADLDKWTIEELDIQPDHNVYVAYPKDFIGEHEEVEVVFVPRDSNNPIEVVYGELAQKESIRPGFRDFVQDKAINMSFNERFYCDDNGYIFNCGSHLTLRDDLFARIEFDEKKIDKLLDELWLGKVNEFFKDRPEYRDLFIKYITTDAEPDILDDGFYFYCARKLLDDKKWMEYTIKKVEVTE
jgi:hypothetical protein